MKEYEILNQVDNVHTYGEAASLIVQGLPDDVRTNELKLTIFTEPDGRWSALAEAVKFSVKLGDVLQTNMGKYRYVMHSRNKIATFDSHGVLCIEGNEAICRQLRNGTYRHVGRNIFDVLTEWEAWEVSNA